MSFTWPKTIDFGQEEASLENGRKTDFPNPKIAKGFWPPSGQSKTALRAGFCACLPAHDKQTLAPRGAQCGIMRGRGAGPLLCRLKRSVRKHYVVNSGRSCWRGIGRIEKMVIVTCIRKKLGCLRRRALYACGGNGAVAPDGAFECRRELLRVIEIDEIAASSELQPFALNQNVRCALPG